jgi:hypothetical protein
MFMESSPSEGLKKDLEQNNGILRDLLEDFAKTAREPWLRLEILCFYELRKTEKIGFRDYVSNSLRYSCKYHISHHHM